MNSIQSASLRLLLRPPLDRNILKPGIYSPTSLVQDIEKASCPDHLVTDQDIMNILVKYFHAYIHPGSIETVISLKEISAGFDAFVHRRLGSELLWDQKELRATLLKYGFALAMLADIPKSAAIFREIAGQTLNPDEYKDTFLGLDIGAGTGILMLAQQIAARRNRFSRMEIIGLERDQPTCERTSLIARTLRLGKVSMADARKVSSYDCLKNRPVTCVTNETLPGASARLWKEDFIKINRVLFANFSHLLAKAFFFPARVIAAEISGKNAVILNQDNHFHQIPGKPLHLMYPRAIELKGRLYSLPDIGCDFRPYLEDPWPSVLSRRW
ncbi:hypothetical protein [Desulfonatronovibrio hydrogenovorans]|uniref:hypothetical protein n=1 Tax=Desulfonatronovibrio hydrogenovorans TaxID=53245 RepID=UPI0004913741|nr:hypothetical protein [Desulfonatronovibrio hydrogenovorans]